MQNKCHQKLLKLSPTAKIPCPNRTSTISGHRCQLWIEIWPFLFTCSRKLAKEDQKWSNWPPRPISKHSDIFVDKMVHGFVGSNRSQMSNDRPISNKIQQIVISKTQFIWRHSSQHCASKTAITTNDAIAQLHIDI